MLISLALDFRRADLHTRERFHLSEQRVGQLYDEPRRTPVDELALVSTCNRIELYGWASVEEPAAVSHALAELARRWMASDARVEELVATATHRTGEAVARHLMRVTAGLESLVLGDAQILGQVRRAYQRAVEADAVGAGLHRLFDTALHAAKRVQTETGLIARRNSVGGEAASVAARRCGPLDGRRCMVIGCGKTGEAAARQLVKLGAVDVVLVNRTPQRAADLATELWGRAAPFDAMHREMALADVAIVATSADRPPVRAASLRFCRELAGTHERALVVIDLSMPRNVEPEVAGLPGVTLLDLDALHVPLATAEAERWRAVPAAEHIVEDELARLRVWLSISPARDAIQPLRAVLTELCRREIAYAAGDYAADRAAERIASKLLAHPMQAMRSAMERGESLEPYADALRALFPTLTEHAPRLLSRVSR
jgi:glutamyl-tRNA reductase